MRAADELLGVVFNRDHRHVIPIFQRPYVWDEDDNWIPLWNDLRKAVEGAERESPDGAEPEEYFLGAFVTQHEDPVPRRPGSSMVIDGQQRMTTLQVFLAAARRAAQEQDALGAASSLETLIRNRVNPHTDHPGDVYKLTPLTTDRLAFEWAMRDNTRLATPPPDASHRLVRAATFFDESLREWLSEAEDPTDRLEMLHFAINNRVKVVSVYLDGKDDPQVIFEALNHAGVRLDAADLIKNLLFQTLVPQGDKGLERELLEDHWDLLDTDAWRREVTTGRIKRVRIDTLLAYWLSVQRGEESSVEHLFEDFKRWMRATGPRAAEVIRSIRRYADTMDALQRRPLTDPVAQVVDRLDTSGTTTPWPLLLFLHAHDDIPHEQATRGALAIDSFLVRRTVCRLTTKDYNRLFASVLGALRKADHGQAGEVLIEHLAAQTAPSRIWPNDREFMLALNRPDTYTGLVRARLKAVLIGIENTLLRDARSESSVPWSSGDKGLTIEHLLPVAWESGWPLASQDEQTLERRERSVHNLGNLTLLTQSLNSSLSNGPWSQKRPAIQRNSLVRITQASVLNKPVGTQRYTDDEWAAAWDEDRIELRATWLSLVAVRAWPGPPGGSALRIPEVPEETARSTVRKPTHRQTATSGHRRPAGAVAQHVREVFRREPPGTELTVAQVVARQSSVYSPGTVSAGAVNQWISTTSAKEFAWSPGSSPRRIRRISPQSEVTPEPPTPSAAELEREFHRAMTDLYKRSQSEVGYHPTAFIRMVSESGGAETARRLVRSSTPSDGFTVLWEAGRLDLAAEALVVLPRYAVLFDDELIERARRRLSDHGFTT